MADATPVTAKQKKAEQPAPMKAKTPVANDGTYKVPGGSPLENHKAVREDF